MKKESSPLSFYVRLWLGTFALIVIFAMQSQGLVLALLYGIFFSVPATLLVSIPALLLLEMVYSQFFGKK